MEVTTNIKVYNLQPKQLEFSRVKAKYRLFGGAKGGGKSYGMRAEVTKQALTRENLRGLVLRRTMPEIQENMITPIMTELPNMIYSYNSTSKILKFNNGSTVRFSYCQSIKDVIRYQGIEYDFICIEELTHWLYEERQILMSSLRTTKEGRYTNAFFSTNPGGIGHNRVRRIFLDRNFFEGEDPNDFAFIPAKVRDNQILIKNDPSYLKRLENLPEMKRRAYLDGDRDAFEGQFFTEFRRDVHVIENTMVDNRIIKYRIIAGDYGFASPSAFYWIAVTNQDEVIIYRELYMTGLTYRNLAIKIKELTTDEEEIKCIIVDPSIIAKKSETTGSTATQEFAIEGLKILGANNNRLQGWDTFREYLKVYKDPNTKDETAKLKICIGCNNIIRTIPEMIYDTNNVEDMNTKTEDHAVDGVRYGLMYIKTGGLSMKQVEKANDNLYKQGYNIDQDYNF